jgi:hypothetical protein
LLKKGSKKHFTTSNASLNSKSKSTSKIPINIDRNEIFKEFCLYNLNAKSSNKFNKVKDLDKSLSNTSKSKMTKNNSNLLPIRTIKVKRDDALISGKRTLNSTQVEYNKSKEKIYYNDIYRKIEGDENYASDPNQAKEKSKFSKFNSINNSSYSNKKNLKINTQGGRNDNSRLRNNKIKVDIYGMFYNFLIFRFI